MRVQCPIIQKTGSHDTFYFLIHQKCNQHYHTTWNRLNKIITQVNGYQQRKNSDNFLQNSPRELNYTDFTPGNKKCLSFRHSYTMLCQQKVPRYYHKTRSSFQTVKLEAMTLVCQIYRCAVILCGCMWLIRQWFAHSASGYCYLVIATFVTAFTDVSQKMRTNIEILCLYIKNCCGEKFCRINYNYAII